MKSEVWTISADELVAHLRALEAPDALYWDSRKLKQDGRKFQNLPWSHWPKPSKVDGKWVFADRADAAPGNPSPVEARLEQAPACKIINLTDAERDLYHGAGWQLARFVGGVLAEIYDPGEHVTWDSEPQAMADATAAAVMAWLKGAEGEVWLVMCSCGQLCEPRRITSADPTSLAHALRLLCSEECL